MKGRIHLIFIYFLICENAGYLIHLALDFTSCLKAYSQFLSLPAMVTFSSGSSGMLTRTKFEWAICLIRYLCRLSILECSNSIMTGKFSMTSSTASRRLSVLDPEKVKSQYPSLVFFQFTAVPYSSKSRFRLVPSRPITRPPLSGAIFLRIILFFN